MTCAVLIKPSARRELEALPDHMLRRADRVIAALGVVPRPRGSVKLRGTADLFRVRVGDYRVVYRVDDPGRIVEVTRIGHRRDVYR